jgi:hypothetical protein
MSDAEDIKVLILTGAGENFCYGGDVHEIIGPLTKLDIPGLLAFTQMTGNSLKAMRACDTVAEGSAEVFLPSTWPFRVGFGNRHLFDTFDT